MLLYHPTKCSLRYSPLRFLINATQILELPVKYLHKNVAIHLNIYSLQCMGIQGVCHLTRLWIKRVIFFHVKSNLQAYSTHGNGIHIYINQRVNPSPKALLSIKDKLLFRDNKKGVRVSSLWDKPWTNTRDIFFFLSHLEHL